MLAKKICSARITMRTISEADFTILHSWRNSNDYIRLFSIVRNTVSFEKFVCDKKKTLESKKESHFFIQRNITDNPPLGTIYAYDINQIDGHAFIGLYIDQKYRKCGYGAEAGVLMVCHLFDSLQLRKIYCDVFCYNSQSISLMKNLEFHIEGTFKEHSFYEGRWHDVIRFAIFRDDTDRIRRLQGKFLRQRFGREEV